MTLKALGYRLAYEISRGLSPRAAFRLAERLADIQWGRSVTDRAAVRRNLSMVVGEDLSDRAPAVREVFRNFGRYLVEFFRIDRMPHPQVDVNGRQHVEQARQSPHGAIVLTAHLGNWELAGVALQRMGTPIAAVALPHDDPSMDRLFNTQRRRCGIDVIPLGVDAAHRCLRSLQPGRFLGLLGDREFGSNDMRMRLCGRDVMLPRGPALLSLRAQAPLFPVFLIREGPWAFRLYCEPPIWPAEQDRGESALQQLTERYAAVLERYLRQFPEQWLMFQPIEADAACDMRSGQEATMLRSEFPMPTVR